ncbi:hypothetical protein QWY85_19335 [Neolewinella lacunae]|uniref:Uncharacterized protein n=1 Tax=Neolewinella lacunae TaxID=1517758 RepID=A0A923TC49_9BACT|nr:hypothetical protein [Neolewinella lacunae]MBC6993327.1 hypothetical protein [Neolewinella lacunae]MDN3636832.1 hypothetical protein [Neolewinella lacunae]
MPTKANFAIYLQALGGKFIGQNAFYPQDIKVYVAINGNAQQLPYFSGPTTPPDDGEVGVAYFDGASSVVPILTNHPTQAVVPVTVNYLTPQPGLTVVAQGLVDLNDNDINTPTEVLVYYPVPGPNGSVKTLTLRQPVILSPFQLNYKLTLVIPGLLVHTPVLTNNQISAVVTMMCGCKVSNGSTPPFWLPADFTVLANVVYKNRPTVQVPLSLVTTGSASTFAGALAVTTDIESITVTANQKSTGNFGANQLTF